MLNYNQIKEKAQKVLKDFVQADEETAPVLDEIDMDILSTAIAEALTHEEESNENKDESR